jgi:hypothetical protein
MGKELLTEVENDDIRKEIKEREQQQGKVRVEDKDPKRKQENLIE